MDHQVACFPPTGAWRIRTCIALAAMVNGLGCATVRPTAVSPDEIPALEAQVASEPTNGAVRHR